MKKIVLAAAMLVGLVFGGISGSRAHSGGTNSEGCHRETATNGYHCH